MGENVSYVSIDGRDYLPKELYEAIEKLRSLKKYSVIGLVNLTCALGIPTAYVAYAQGSGKGPVEVLQNSSLESLLFLGGLFVVNAFNTYSTFVISHQLKKELEPLRRLYSL